jgi:Tol biopolymer transport system component
MRRPVLVTVLSGLSALALLPAPASATFAGKPGRIAYEAFGGSGGSDGVYSIARDGSDNRLIVPGGRDPSWSRRGTRLVFVQGDALWWARADGSHRHRIVSTSRIEDATDFYEPVWSPDGRQVAFGVSGEVIDDEDTFSDVYTVNTDGSLLRKRAVGSAVSWAPDGRHIAYVHHGDEIRWMRPNGRHKRLLVRTEGTSGSLDFSPNGRRLVYLNTPSGGPQPSGEQRIQVLDVKTRKVRRFRTLRTASAFANHPFWRPAGGRIAFAYVRFGSSLPHELRTIGRKGHGVRTVFPIPDDLIPERLSWQALPRRR